MAHYTYRMRAFRASILTIFIFTHTIFIYPSAISIRTGAIEFPLTLQRIPNVEIFYEGQKIKVEIETNKLVFNIPMSRMQWRFFILFVENADYVLKSSDGLTVQNTVDYQIVQSGIPYRVFELQTQGDQWLIAERLLPDNGRIPDSTIIVYFPPNYIDTVTGGNRLELPHVLIKDNIVELAGGEELLQEKADELSLATIDTAMLHMPMKETVRLAGNRVLVIPTV
jgi:hypothetical protein